MTTTNSQFTSHYDPFESAISACMAQKQGLLLRWPHEILFCYLVVGDNYVVRLTYLLPSISSQNRPTVYGDIVSGTMWSPTATTARIILLPV